MRKVYCLNLLVMIAAVLSFGCICKTTAKKNPLSTSAGQIKIGWASADISTDQPIYIPGQFYMRFSKKILDPVTATALWMSDGKDDVCFLSADLIAVRAGLTDELYKEIKKRNKNIPVEKIIFNATHTHTGPGYYDNNVIVENLKNEKISQVENKKTSTASAAKLKGDVPMPTSVKGMDITEYRKILVKRLADIVCEAYDKCSSGSIAYGYGFAVVGHSRRVLYTDDLSKRPNAVKNSAHGVNGHCKMYGSTSDDKFAGYEGGADPYVNLLFTFDENKKLTGVIVNVPCPSQNSERLYMLSASFWHDTREAIRKKFGNIFILAQSAAGGDVAPRQLHYTQAEKRRHMLKYGKEEKYYEEFRRRDIAERIAACINEVYSWAKKDLISHAPIQHEVRNIELQRRFLGQREYQEACEMLKKLNERSFLPESDKEDINLTLRKNSRLVSERNRCKRVILRWNEQHKNNKYNTQIHVLRIGDIAFATNQFELFTDFQHRIQGRSPFIQTFIVQLTGVSGNDGGSYLATERAEGNRGYSASVFCNKVSWQGGDALVEETVKILKELKK